LKTQFQTPLETCLDIELRIRFVQEFWKEDEGKGEKTNFIAMSKLSLDQFKMSILSL